MQRTQKKIISHSLIKAPAVIFIQCFKYETNRMLLVANLRKIIKLYLFRLFFGLLYCTRKALEAGHSASQKQRQSTAEIKRTLQLTMRNERGERLLKM